MNKTTEEKARAVSLTYDDRQLLREVLRFYAENKRGKTFDTDKKIGRLMNKIKDE